MSIKFDILSDQNLLKIPWNGQNKYQETALHYACRSRPWLVRQMEDHQIKDRSGNTALHVACVFHTNIIQFLKDHQIPDINGDTALHTLADFYRQYTPLLRWHQKLNGYGQTPRDVMKWYSNYHVHVLAKLRRLLGTLPAAYIRLVHGYT